MDVKLKITTGDRGLNGIYALRHALNEATERIRAHWTGNPAVLAADYARSLGHEVDQAAAFKAQQLCDETVYLKPPETAKPMSDAPGALAQQVGDHPFLQMLAASPRVQMERSSEGHLVFNLPAINASDLNDEGVNKVLDGAVHCGDVSGEGYSSEHRVDWHKPSMFATLLPFQWPDIGPAEPIAKCDTMPESKALAGHQWNTSEWLNGKPNTTYMIDGVPMAAATVQRSDLLHAALAKTEAAARFVPVEAREGARISDMEGIAEEIDRQVAEPTVAEVLAEARGNRPPGVKAALSGLTTTADGDHRFGRWGAVE